MDGSPERRLCTISCSFTCLLFQGERTIDSLINELDELQLERLQAKRQHKGSDNTHKRSEDGHRREKTGKDEPRVRPIEEADSLDIENLKHLLKGLVSDGAGKLAAAANAPPVPRFNEFAKKNNRRVEGDNKVDEEFGERLNTSFAIDELPSIDSSILLTEEHSEQQVASLMDNLGKKMEQKQQKVSCHVECVGRVSRFLHAPTPHNHQADSGPTLY